ncbi:MAG: type I restriction enzyme HsdR N-terminal domain-containing protein [Desulfobacterales bacterium]|nr:type I restriction enzyme HsdR N-terminal domain-containing protein [Desulfobacterales bacterium]
MGKGYVILGETTDFLTGETITLTHDEQARQQIVRYIVEEKGYQKNEIASRIMLPVTVDGKTGHARIDFVVRLEGTAYAIVVYGPGSLVSRHKPAIAAACLIEAYTVPVTVVTNGIDAHVLDTDTGKVIGEGLAAMAPRESAVASLRAHPPAPVSEKRREKAGRILYVMDILTERECDDSCELCR